MFFDYKNENIRYTGRWGMATAWALNGQMTAAAPGSYFEFAYKGVFAEMQFNTDLSYEPHGHVYIEVDGGARIDAR
jgi:hypothetical protein